MKALYIILAILFSAIFFRYAKLLVLRSRITHRYLPVLSAVELAIWGAIVFGITDLFLSRELYYPYVVVMLLLVFMVLLVWFYLKDIVAGYLFAIRHNPIKGQILESEKLKGTIRLVGLSQLTIETEDGRWCRIPYSSLVTKSLSLQSQHALAPGETVIKVRFETPVDPGYLARAIREALALSSWCVVSKPITVQPSSEEEGIFRISFFLLDPSYLPLAKEKLSKLAGKLRATGDEDGELER